MRCFPEGDTFILSVSLRGRENTLSASRFYDLADLNSPSLRPLDLGKVPGDETLETSPNEREYCVASPRSIRLFFQFLFEDAKIH